MKLYQAITIRIKNLCKERNIKPNKLANMAGMPPGSLKSIFYGKSKNTGTRTILDLCRALEITLFDFYDDELFKTTDFED